MNGCRPLTDNEAIELKASLKCLRDQAIFVMGVRSGFRISEILSLRVKDVSQHGKIVDHVTVAKQNMKKKTASRTVILHSEVREALSSLLASRYYKPDQYLFSAPHSPTRPISRIQAYRIIKAAANELKLIGKVGTHTMRKTFAQRMYNKLDHDLVKTARSLGHKSINSTVSYLSFAEEDIEQAIMEA